jgi:hypothetical protein
MSIDDLYPDNPFTEEETKTLEKLQGNEYAAEYFFLQMKKSKMYTDYLLERVQYEQDLIKKNKFDIDNSLEKLEKIASFALKSVLEYMTLTLIDMKYFDVDKAADSITDTDNMNQVIDLLTEKFKNYLFPIESKENTALSKFFEDIAKQPEYYLFGRDRINNMLVNRPIPLLTEIEVDEKGKKDKSKLKINSILTFDIDSAIKDTDLIEHKIVISAFDKQVMNAVITLRRAGNTTITQQQIYQVITHATPSKISDQWKNAIDESITKLNSILITADFSSVLDYYPELKDIEQITKRTRLIQVEETTVKHRNGTTGKAYEILKDPILFTIAEAKNQIGTIPLKELINTKTEKSIDSSVLYNLLLERIVGMKHPTHPLDKTIVLESIYKTLNKTTTKEKRTTREKVDQLLFQFQADKKIKSYECVYEKKKITKYVITV